LFEEISTNLRNLLQTNLRDPYNDTVNSPRDWITIDYPDLEKDTPIISITNTGISRSEIGIGRQLGGTIGERYTLIFDLDIWVKMAEIFTITIDATPTKKGSGALRDWLRDEITKLLRDQRLKFVQDNSLEDFKIIGGRVHPYDEEIDRLRATIIVQIDLIKS